MSPEFAFPDWATPPDPLSSPPPAVDPHRVGDLVNGFIAAKQDALFDAPDAFYRQSGGDAVAAAPAVAQRLTGLRDATLEQAANEGEHQALQTQLDAQLADALDGIDRHVTRHREVRNRAILSERQRLIERSAALEHNNDEKLTGLAEANASAAQLLAQMDGVPEEPAMQAARSAVWRNAIAERIASGQGLQALTLFDRTKHQLASTDQRALAAPMEAARTEATADAWIAREQDSPGEPLGTRSQADPDLSDAEKATIRARIEARDSAKESARVAAVKRLDDAFEAASDAVASTPGTYRPGTLAALANAYENAGEAAMADPVRRLAERESFLLSFARSSTAAQQRLINNLPEGEERTARKRSRNDR